MPVSNVFVLPTAGKSFTLSLNDFNNSFLTVWSNFYGPNIPTSADINIGGAATAPYDGMLYRHSSYKAFYTYNPDALKGGGIGSGFTRVGLGNRNFESITALVANIANIEQSELCSVVGDSSANYRVYMRTTNAGAIVDIGIPPASSLTSGMFIARQVPNTALVASSVTGHEMSSDLIYRSRITVDAMAERSISTSISGNVLDLDVGVASLHRVNVTSHINSIKFSNTAGTSWGVSVVFYGNGTAYNFNTNSNVAYPSSNSAVTLTSTAGRRDSISFVSPDGNLPAMAFGGGQGF